ncbi:TonB-dependent receptor domain-containing protein [Tepidimonas aquatica]|nr:TonB-dependent receptor [Tepidimonas aquatica]
MKRTTQRARWGVLPLATAAAVACMPAAAETQALAETVVVATRAEQPLTDVVADVSIIDRERIEASGAAGLADVLAQLPGIEIARNGGVGGTTSVFIRGAETRFVAVFIDGVRVDSQSTGGAAWNALPLAHVERIEVVRGPLAAIYGSDALGGVVHIVTRTGEAGWQPSVEVGAGSHGTQRVAASVRGAQGPWSLALGVQRELSDGFNVQPAANPDRDGHRARSAHMRLGWTPAAGHTLTLSALDSRMEAQYDGYMSTADDWATQDVRTVGVTWDARWSDVYASRVALGRGTDRYSTRPSPYQTDTEVSTYLWQHQWLQGPHRIQLGLERREDRLLNASTTPNRTRRSQDAVALGYGWAERGRALQVNVRHDDDSEFGGQTTASVGAAWSPRPGWRLRANAGSAFRAPTLFQRFSIYGVPSLQPETSRNIELGAQWRTGVHHVGATWYRNRVRDLIQYVPGPGPCVNGSGTWAGCYGNVGRATLQGWTLEGGTQMAGVRLTGSLDLADPRNDLTGKRLTRRAARYATLRAETTAAPVRWGVEWRLVGQRWDDAANTKRLGGYGLVNVSLRGALARDWQWLARVDNLGGQAYETARGYATGGRSVFVGVQWTPAPSN